MSQTTLGPANLTSRDALLEINNDLETINQVLYLLSAESSEARLKSFVGVGQSALRRVADAFAGLVETTP